MATLTSGKAVEIMAETFIDTFKDQTSLIELCKSVRVDKSSLQNAGNSIWRPVRQRSASIAGTDLTGQQQGVIKQMYQATLGTPDNDLVELSVTDIRDESYFRERGEEAATQRATNLNQAIANLIKNTGSLTYRDNSTSGLGFIGKGKNIMDKLQIAKGKRNFILCDDHELLYATDLAAKQTLQGRPDAAWNTGQIGKNVSGFDIYSSSSIGLLLGGALTTTVTGNQSFAPLGGTVNQATGVVTNNDFRGAIIPVAASAGYAVGDSVNYTNGATTVKSLGFADKTVTNHAFTSTIVSIPDGTHIEVWPRPIALSDAALSLTEKSYANINTQILNGATVTRVNTDSSTTPSLFMHGDSIEIISGDVDLNLFKQGGQMTFSKTIPGTDLQLCMLYDSDIVKFSATMRCFIWYGVNNANPGANGRAIKF